MRYGARVRVKCVLAALCALLMVQTAGQHALASDWINLLKPFVRDVVAPAATQAAKRWVEKKTGRSLDSTGLVEVPPALTDEVISMPDLYTAQEITPAGVETVVDWSDVPPPPPPPPVLTP